MYPTKIEEDYIMRNLLDVKEKLPAHIEHMSYQQLSLFDDVNFRMEQFTIRDHMGKTEIEKIVG